MIRTQSVRITFFGSLVIAIAEYLKSDRMITTMRSPIWVKYVADGTIKAGHD
ncbi:MAG: hypothetical protein WCP16_13810 [Pseudanabaena sp. ELA645]